MENLQDLQEKLLAGIRSAAGLKELDELRVAALGKKGSITEKMKTLGTLPPEEKIAAGKALNLLKSAVENAVESRKSELETIELNRRLAGESIDVTLPVRPETQGRIHPVSKIYEEVVAIFGEMGFEVAEGPDIEDQFHNFNALNMPPNHPARQMQDTFYINNDANKEFDMDSAEPLFPHRRFLRATRLLKSALRSCVSRLLVRTHTSWHGQQHRGHFRPTLHFV